MRSRLHACAGRRPVPPAWRMAAAGGVHQLAALIATLSALSTAISFTRPAEPAATTAALLPLQLAPAMLAACSLQRVALAGSHSRQCSSRSPRAVVPQRRRLAAAPAASLQQRERQTQQQQQPQEQQQPAPVSLASLAALWALAADLPAAAADIDLSGGPPASSYYVSLGLFLITVPGASQGGLRSTGKKRALPVASCRASAAALPAAVQLGTRLVSARPAPTHAVSAAAKMLFMLMLLHVLLIVFCRQSLNAAGLWSLIKRSPKAKIKRKTFEVAGPAQVNFSSIDLLI